MHDWKQLKKSFTNAQRRFYDPLPKRVNTNPNHLIDTHEETLSPKENPPAEKIPRAGAV